MIDFRWKNERVAKHSAIRGYSLRTLLILVTMRMSSRRDVGVLQRYGLPYCMVVVVRACQGRATRLNNPDNPEQEPAKKQNTCRPGAFGVLPRARLHPLMRSYSLLCHGVDDKAACVRKT